MQLQMEDQAVEQPALLQEVSHHLLVKDLKVGMGMALAQMRSQQVAAAALAQLL
tara:strand:+ start:289 stop:450 length:162 start_codon:yes stop_codon:yes gene_type:complete